MKFEPKKLTATKKSVVLSVIAGIGVVATGFLSARGVRKAADKETRKEKVIAYAPAVAVGAATIGCIAGSTYISTEEIAMVTATCAAIGQRFADYKKSVEEVATDEERKQIDISFYEKEIERLEHELAEREHPRDDDDWCTFVDSYSGYTFKAPLEQVEYGLKEAMDLYDEQGFLHWGDIFFFVNNGDMGPHNAMLGSHYYEGDYNGVGWSKAMFEDMFDNIDYDFDIALVEIEGKSNAYSIEYATTPECSFLEY